jgi:16S rRNA (guanine527-N7)-methyltransferase
MGRAPAGDAAPDRGNTRPAERVEHLPAVHPATPGASGDVDPHRRLDALCRELGLATTAHQTAQLLDFLALLQRWNHTHNLTALRDLESAWTHHLADCLAMLPALCRQLPPDAQVAGGASRPRVLDVGSGGGLPGVVIAILRPDLEVTCVDSVGKKVAFLRQAAGALSLPNLRAVHARVEALPSRERFAVIASRAFASLPDFVRLTSPLLGPDGAWMAMKGRRPDDEIAALPPDVDVFHVEPITVPGLDAERCIVWMRTRDGASPNPTAPIDTAP